LRVTVCSVEVLYAEVELKGVVVWGSVGYCAVAVACDDLEDDVVGEDSEGCGVIGTIGIASRICHIESVTC